MQASTTPTHILVKASTPSDWDGVDYIIVELYNDWLQEQCKRIEAIKAMPELDNFYNVQFFDSNVSYHVTSDDIELDSILNGEEYTLVEISAEELSSIKQSVPEAQLDAHILHIRKDGRAHYSCYSKHGNEEYYSEEFPLLEIIKNK